MSNNNSLNGGHHRSSINDANGQDLVGRRVTSLRLLNLCLVCVTLLVICRNYARMLRSRRINVGATTTSLVTAQLNSNDLTRSTRRKSRRRCATARQEALLRRLRAIRVVRFRLVALRNVVVATISNCLRASFLRRLSRIIRVRSIQRVNGTRKFVNGGNNASRLRHLVLNSLQNSNALRQVATLCSRELRGLIWLLWSSCLGCGG